MKKLFYVTLFDRLAPDCQVKVALWAPTKGAAHERGLECGGRVIAVQRAIGTWPLDARTPKQSKKTIRAWTA